MFSNMEINRYLDIKQGSFLGMDHKVIKLLSKGYFAYVYNCLNTKTNKMEAVKITTTNSRNSRKARQEIAILKLLQRSDPDAFNIIKYYGFFYHGDYICIRLELLDQSLGKYMNEKRGLPMPELRPIIQQLAIALSHLSSVKIIHADIKLENVMIVDRLETPLRVKLIDFGLSHLKMTAFPHGFVQDMWCKSPEALISSPYDEAVDMWSLGMIAVELATGIYLYPGCTEYEMLRFIIEIQGQPSDKVLDCGRKTYVYFNKEDNGGQRWRFKTPEELDQNSNDKDANSEDKFPTVIRPKCLDDLRGLMCNDHKHQWAQCLLVDLIKRMLQLDQDQRIKPQEVLQHSFFTESLPERSEAITHMETVDEGTENIQESSLDETAGTEDIPCRGSTVSLAAESKDDTGDNQPETGAQNGGCLLRRLIRWIMDTVLDFLPQ